MQVHRNIDSLPSFRNAVITVGTFDGVHLGHCKLIERIRELAKLNNGESVLITFDPHPRTVIQPDDYSLKVLCTLDEKISHLEKFRIDHLVIVPFTKEFSLLSAREYVSEFLVAKFHPAVIVIGFNHHFGHHRDGNIELLRKLSGEFNFQVEEIQRQLVEDIEVSSTRIRIALQEGDVKTAAHLLGYNYSLHGTVVKGNQLGRKLGFPTANLAVNDPLKLIPADGIYAVVNHFTSERQNVSLNGVMSIGFRPTVNGTHRTLETFIFDFTGDLYGTILRIEFVEWIRSEQKFETVELMIEEIKRDEQKARKILQKT